MEETEGESSKPGEKQLSRRGFVRLATLGGIEAWLALAGCKVINVKSTPPPTSPETPTLLKETATAITAKGEQTSFVEQPGFPKELLEKTRQGTFVMQTIDQSYAKDKVAVAGGTSWLFKIEGNNYYFVTNRHVLKDFAVGQLRFWRPFIDTEPFQPDKMSYATHPNLDLAVIKCTGTYITDTPPQPLHWKDNVQLKKGDKVLTVGYPDEFTKKEDINYRNAFALAEVLTVEGDADTNGQWFAKGLGSHGMSGEPTVINQDGQPLVVGIGFAGADGSDGQSLQLGQKLDIAPLLNLLKAQT